MSGRKTTRVEIVARVPTKSSRASHLLRLTISRARDNVNCASAGIILVNSWNDDDVSSVQIEVGSGGLLRRRCGVVERNPLRLVAFVSHHENSAIRGKLGEAASESDRRDHRGRALKLVVSGVSGLADHGDRIAVNLADQNRDLGV